MKDNIAFIGWNSFQFYHFLPLINKIPSAKFILDKRKRENCFDEEVLSTYDDRIIMVDQHEIGSLDGKFDLFVCQTPFKQIFKIEKTPIAMLQYGYAKEPHNYGAWRALADVNLVYGPYAANKIKHYSPVEITGNPSYDAFNTLSKKQQIVQRYQPKIDDSKKTLVYAPTWGDLSSLDNYLEAIASLSDLYNVIIKVHHNTHIIDVDMWQRIQALSNVLVLGANDGLLDVISLADVVVSDYSGAIFDALYFNKPIILLNNEFQQSVKLDSYSIEYARRSELGIEVNSPLEIKLAIEKAIEMADDSERSKAIQNELFFATDNAVENATKVLLKAADGDYTLTQNQKYVRESIRLLYKTQYDFAEYKKNNKGVINKIKNNIGL